MKIGNLLEKCLEDPEHDLDELEILTNQLNKKWCVINEKEIPELLANDSACSQDTFDLDYNDYESYKERYICLETKVDKILIRSNDNKTVISEVSNKWWYFQKCN